MEEQEADNGNEQYEMTAIATGEVEPPHRESQRFSTMAPAVSGGNRTISEG